MKQDLIIILASELVRKDFGDLISTVFFIICYHKNCNLLLLNSSLKNVEYKILRNTIVTLFQHNLIYTNIFISDFFEIHYKLESIIIKPRICEVFMRIRFSKFLCFSEHEYGTEAIKLTQQFMRNGQIKINNLLECSSIEIHKTLYLEDIIVQMNRDGFIDLTKNLRQINVNSSNLNVSKFTLLRNKAIIKSIYHWNMSYSKFVLFNKLSISLSLFGDKISKLSHEILRYFFCKLINFKYSYLFRIFIPLDCLSDGLLDLNENSITNDIILFKVKDLCLKDKFLNLSKSYFNIELDKIFDIISSSFIKNYSYINFGNKFSDLIELFTVFGKMNIKELIKYSGTSLKCCKKILYRLFRLGVLYLTENIFQKDEHAKNEELEYRLEMFEFKNKILNEILKSAINFFIRYENMKIYMIKLCKINQKNIITHQDVTLKIKNDLQLIFVIISRLDEWLIYLM
ncbi:hypothetical protein (nucleomorph) [Guillardia theta]|uniref:DNA-directed RNA polymerase III subunit RPC3 n=1 Tax=Guillardia theta TaxID=55529 RepID=Q98S04_GUITH|nr:hypothetical protein GTHECHR3130 [Guillardia theta]AAK39774.1 hypothetical protein [Guillardia theta]|mmetsp:Transcript_36820/g.115212  ORF Transcript_36820/g.115212 Transcript_36820/m.115212 type:complete len:457 (+) Transcript_36820:202-1572(+)